MSNKAAFFIKTTVAFANLFFAVTGFIAWAFSISGLVMTFNNPLYKSLPYFFPFFLIMSLINLGFIIGLEY